MESSVSKGEVLDEEQRELFSTMGSLLTQIELLENLVFDISMIQHSYEEFRLRNDETMEVETIAPPYKPRYLCVSNGFEIWLLHLKWSNTIDEPQPLPPPINLPGECFTVSAGLFRWRSIAYQIGGNQILASEEQCDFWSHPDCPNCVPGMKLYSSLFRTHCARVERSSLDTLRLSVVGDAGLSRESESNISGKLKMPKYWPRVEDIDGKLHVFDSLPFLMTSQRGSPVRVFSHEVLDESDGSWAEIPTIDVKDEGKDEDCEWSHSNNYIRSHTVVGNRIYAVAESKFLMYDSGTEKWEATPRDYEMSWKDPFTVRRVWDIIELGFAKCVAEFPLDDPLYVLMAVVRDWRSCDREWSYGAISLAYLVTLAGEVVCVQRLSSRPQMPVRVWEGTIIKVDDDKEEKNTMCVIVHGKVWGDVYNAHLFIQIFSAEVRTDLASQVGNFREVGREGGWPLEEDFVRLQFKEEYVYNTTTEAQRMQHGPNPAYPHIQACFL